MLPLGVLAFLAVPAGVTDALRHNPLLAVATLFGAGVLTSLTPCIYPMIPITAGPLPGRPGVAATRSGVLGFLYLFVFSPGMTALLAVVGISSGSLAALPRSGVWMVWVKRAAGAILIAMAEYYFIHMGQVL